MKKYIILLFIGLLFLNCSKDYLEPKIFSTISNTNFWKTEADAEAGLLYLYSELVKPWDYGYNATGMTVRSDLMTDELKGTRSDFLLTENLLWNASQYQNDFYTISIQMAVRANIVIENIEAMDGIKDETKSKLIAEAKALRAWYLTILYDFYGPGILETSAHPDININKPRATEEEFTTFIVNELKAAANVLPVTAPVGRLTKGAVLTQLMKVYMLMTHFVDKSYFQQVSEIARQIIDLNVYQLQSDYTSIWALDNEGNNEVIYAISRNATVRDGNYSLAHTLPARYVSPEGNPIQAWEVYRVRWDVYDSFETGDLRLKTMLTKYPTKDEKGNFIEIDLRELEGDASAGAVPFKYGEDPNMVGAATNHDDVVYRYPDVLLARAEALNELNGPNQESIDLINEVRTRAGIDGINLANFTSKENFRSRILQERQWELCFEGIRRQDLVRHGLYIKKAYDRGAQGVTSLDDTYLERFAIPQWIIDRNENIIQNPGYN